MYWLYIPLRAIFLLSFPCTIEHLTQPVHAGIRVCIRNELIYLRDSQKSFDDVLIKQFVSEVAVILAGYTLGMVPHGSKGNKLAFLHATKNRNSVSDYLQ